VPVDELVHLGEAPVPRRVAPPAVELGRIRGLARERVPRLLELPLVLLELHLDRPQPPHPDRRPAQRANRRVGVRPEVPQPRLQRLAGHGALRQIRFEDAPLLAIARRLRADRALAHDRLLLPRIHRVHG
jgi:hypothetical protein